MHQLWALNPGTKDSGDVGDTVVTTVMVELWNDTQAWLAFHHHHHHFRAWLAESKHPNYRPYSLGHPPSCRQLSPSLLRSQHQQSLSIIKERRRQINSQLTKASRYTAAWGGTNPQVIKPWIQAKIWKTKDWNQSSASWDSLTVNMWNWYGQRTSRTSRTSMLSVKPVRINRNPQSHQKSSPVCLVSCWEYLSSGTFWGNQNTILFTV